MSSKTVLTDSALSRRASMVSINGSSEAVETISPVLHNADEVSTTPTSVNGLVRIASTTLAFRVTLSLSKINFFTSF
jgi:hypothetical protein